MADLPGPERRRRDAFHPAGDGGKAVAVGGDERRLGHRPVADAAAVHEGLMRQVHQVVDHQAVVALHPDQLAVAGPARAVVPVQVGDQRRVGQRCITRPHPDEAVALHHRIAAHAGRRVQRLLRRHVCAAALCIEYKTVVAADHLVAVQPAHGQRQQAVPAGILQRGGAAVLQAVEHHLAVADGARQQHALELHVVRGGVPGVQRKVGHGRFDSRRCIQPEF